MSISREVSLSQLAGVVGDGNSSIEPEELCGYEVDGMQPAAIARPSSAAEAAELVRYAIAEKLAVIPCGARTKLAMGMPPRQYDLTIDVSRMNALVAYDPADLTVSVCAGMRLCDLEATLEQHRQQLPLAVPFANSATVGGTLASGVDSPLRQLYGTAKDFVLGMEFVTGDGVIAKSGGRVVKNVTGYDLHKLLIGSMGTLGIITRVNFKTFPMWAERRGFVASFAEARQALAMMHRISKSSLAPETLEVVDSRLAEILSRHIPAANVDLVSAGWTLLAGISGRGEVLERYARDLTRTAKETQASVCRVIDESERSAVWTQLREALPLLLEFSPAAAIVKITTTPSECGKVLEQTRGIAERHALASATLVRAAGVIYFALLPATTDAETIQKLAGACEEIFDGAGRGKYRAVIPWCPLELKSRLNIWGSAGDDFALMQKVKSAFDPQGIFSPGRFVGGL
jgi:glycolate oxidase FAD binding subunit